MLRVFASTAVKHCSSTYLFHTNAIHYNVHFCMTPKKAHITTSIHLALSALLLVLTALVPATAMAQTDGDTPNFFGTNNPKSKSAKPDSTTTKVAKDGPPTITGTIAAQTSTQWSSTNYSSSPLALASYANFNIQYKGYTIPIHFNILDVSAFNLGGSIRKNTSESKGSTSSMVDNLVRRLPTPKAAIGISPKIGNMRFHLGSSTMKFSPYVYSGVQFLGGGIEYTGKYFNLGTFYGSLNRPTRYRELDTRSALQQYTDALLGLNTYETMHPQFRRDAVAVKLGIGTTGNGIDLMAMKAKDIEGSLPEILPWADSTIDRSMVVTPKENLALGLAARLSITNHFNLRANLAASVFTPNTLVDTLDMDRIVKTAESADIVLTKALDYLERYKWLYKVQGNTQLRLAGDATTQLRFKHFNLGGQYRFIQSEYTSMGVVSNQQNLQSLGLTGGLNVLKGALVVTASAYGQQDNLNHKQQYTNSVNTYNLNVNGILGDYGTVVFNGNLIHQFQDDGTIAVDPTLRIDQTTINANLMPALSFEGTYNHQVALAVNYISTDNHNPLLISDMDCRTTSLGPAYQLSMQRGRLVIDASYDFSHSLSQYSNYDAHTLGLGCFYQIARNETNKLTSNLTTSLSINNVKEQGDVDAVLDMNKRMGFIKGTGYEVTEMQTTTFDISGQLTWTHKSGHSAFFRTSLRNFSNREMIAQKVSTTLNVSAMISYSYTFTAKLQRKTKADTTPTLSNNTHSQKDPNTKEDETK